MTASNHLRRFPNARASTLAYLEKRDAKTAELREELKPKGWALPRAFRAVAQAISALGRPK